MVISVVIAHEGSGTSLDHQAGFLLRGGMVLRLEL